MRAILITILFLLVASGGSAEIYLGILLFETLGDIKKRFPQAHYERRNPAWAKETDVLYRALQAMD